MLWSSCPSSPSLTVPPCLASELPLRYLGFSLLPHTRWLHLLRSVLGSCLSSSPEFSEAPFWLCISFVCGAVDPGTGAWAHPRLSD